MCRIERDNITRVAIPGEPNGLAFRNDSGSICDAGGNRLLELRSDLTVSALLTSQPELTRPNDLAFDRRGNLVFTCPGDSRTAPTGSIWSRSAGGVLTLIADQLYFPNGLAFTPDGTELIVAETYRHRLWRGQWDELRCCWSNARPWVDVGGPTGPDGMAFAADGRLLVALFGQGVVRVVARDGAMLDDIPVPGARPTNVAIDPSGRHGLIVTEAEHGRVLSLPGFTALPALFDR